jgi:hypothetical protein
MVLNTNIISTIITKEKLYNDIMFRRMIFLIYYMLVLGIADTYKKVF